MDDVQQADEIVARAENRVGSYAFESQFGDPNTLLANPELVGRVLEATEDEPPGCFGLKWNGPPLRLLSRVGLGDEPVSGGALFDVVDSLRGLDWADGACADWLELYDAYVVRVWCDVRTLDPKRWGDIRSIDGSVRGQLDLSSRVEEHLSSVHGMEAPACQLVTLNTNAMLVVTPSTFWCGGEDAVEEDEVAVPNADAQALSQLLWGGGDD